MNIRRSVQRAVQLQEARKAKFGLADAETHLKAQGFERNEVTSLSRSEGGPLMHNWNKGTKDVSLYHNGTHVHSYGINDDSWTEPKWHDSKDLDTFKGHAAE